MACRMVALHDFTTWFILYATSRLLNINLGYIVENVPNVSSSRSRMLESMHKIHSILGVPVLIDAAAMGSQAHHLCFWWTNLVPVELLQSTISHTRWPDFYVSNILDPHWTP